MINKFNKKKIIVYTIKAEDSYSRVSFDSLLMRDNRNTGDVQAIGASNHRFESKHEDDAGLSKCLLKIHLSLSKTRFIPHCHRGAIQSIDLAVRASLL